MGWMTGVQFPDGTGNFFLRHCVQTSSADQPPSHPLGTGSPFPAKQPGREANHSFQSSTEIKNVWIYTSTPHTSS